MTVDAHTSASGVNTCAQDHSYPEVCCFPIGDTFLLAIKDTETFRAGISGVESARDLAFWDDGVGQWEGFALDHPLRVDPSCPVLLLRRQDVFYIRGLGDALQYIQRVRTKGTFGTALATQDEIEIYQVSSYFSFVH